MDATHKFHRMLSEAMRYESDYRKRNEELFDYYDGAQWSDEESAIIESRGQQPTVINIISPTIDMLKALERDRDPDIQVVGREGGDDDKARVMTELLKHVFDASQFNYYDSAAFTEAMICGRGWLGVNVRRDETGKNQIYAEHIPWEEVYIDPFHRKPDGSDARYMIRVTWIDRDTARKIYKDKGDLINSVFSDNYSGIEDTAQNKAGERGFEFSYYDSSSHRVMICECYYTVPTYVDKKVLNERTGKEEKIKVFIQQVHRVVFSDEIILKGDAEDDEKNTSTLGINFFPWVPVYVSRSRKGEPVGVVKKLIDLQSQINKLNSKFIWCISANRVIMEENATRDPNEFADQMQRPDGLGLLNEGAIQKYRVEENFRDLSYISGHVNFLLAMCQRISGVNDSMLGFGGVNERSGTIQAARISQGATMQTSMLENLYFSRVQIARIVLRLIGKWYTDYRIVRVTAETENVSFLEFNKLNESGQLTNEIEDMLNYDVFFKKSAPFSTVRDRQMQLFSEVFKTGVFPPQIASKLMVLWSEDIPNKGAILAEIESYFQQQQLLATEQMQQKTQPPQAGA